MKQKKTIFISSDMYLPKWFIEEMLDRNGYRDYKKLYLSSDVLKTKAKGDIFGLILGNEKIVAKDLLHIGDNYKSDVSNPRKFGIDAYHLKKTHVKCCRKYEDIDENILESVIQAFIINRSKYADVFERVGYSSFGPLLYGYVSWLKEELRRLQVNKAYFLSRDGHLMKRAFDLINETDIRSYYFYASRRALQVPAIYTNSHYSDVVNSMFLPRIVSIEWFLSKLGLEAKDYIDTMNAYGFQLNDCIDGLKLASNEKVKALYESLLPDILAKAKHEYESFRCYLESNGCDGNVVIIDIGWFGNMQNALRKILSHINNSIKVYGFYLGVVPDSVNQNLLNMRGYLFQKGKNEELYNRERDINTLLEMLFMAPHGSCIAYDKDNGSGVILDEFEYENSDTFEKIASLQNAALHFVCQFNVYSKYLSNNEIVYSENLMKTFCRPSALIANIFGDMQVKDGPMVLSLAKPESWSQYLSSPNSLLPDFRNSTWKIGFLKRIFRLNLRYDNMLLTLRKVYGAFK